MTRVGGRVHPYALSFKHLSDFLILTELRVQSIQYVPLATVQTKWSKDSSLTVQIHVPVMSEGHFHYASPQDSNSHDASNGAASCKSSPSPSQCSAAKDAWRQETHCQAPARYATK